jgi:hypothetical protein
MVGNDHGQTHHDVTQKRVADWEDGLRGVRDWFQIGSNRPGFIVIDRELTATFGSVRRGERL